MDKLSPYRPGNTRSTAFRSVAAILLGVVTVTPLGVCLDWQKNTEVPINAAQIVQKCQALNFLPGPPNNFHQRTQLDRQVSGNPPTLFRNASIWTGRVSGHEVAIGDLLLDKGIIKELGSVKESVLDSYKDLVVIDAGGAWITPGIVNLHSHLGVDSAPALRGSDDTNALKGLVLPWLRSLDGLNTHDEAYRLSISGGVTTGNVLPGSADAIGGQAFTIKLRPTAERSSSSMALELPHMLNGTHVDPLLPPRWRQMKHACGENPSRVSSALNGQWNDIGDFPEDLQWEALVDVLRGRVKVHNHCYEAVDSDGIVHLTNEFKFSIAAFHHAHGTYLVPDLLKKTHLLLPSSRQTQVVMKSDHPVLNSRHLLHEAQHAHYYGLPHNLALASVTSTPATVLSYDHRIGFIKPGYDAATGSLSEQHRSRSSSMELPRSRNPIPVKKPTAFQRVPKTPDFSKEAEDALKYDGLPPLEAKKSDLDMIKHVGQH
ncbi:hypothetical protein BDZ97DRAFT_1920686 [Flammula alnicola]|nr:hypothetical protein BDZ97DRAFT_1920686 [Flammula alnicola]